MISRINHKRLLGGGISQQVTLDFISADIPFNGLDKYVFSRPLRLGLRQPSVQGQTHQWANAETQGLTDPL